MQCITSHNDLRSIFFDTNTFLLILFFNMYILLIIVETIAFNFDCAFTGCPEVKYHYIIPNMFNIINIFIILSNTTIFTLAVFASHLVI